MEKDQFTMPRESAIKAMQRKIRTVELPSMRMLR